MLFFSFATEVEGEKNANNAFVSIVDLAWPPDIDASDVQDAESIYARSYTSNESRGTSYKGFANDCYETAR